IRDDLVTGVQTCALPIFLHHVFWRLGDNPALVIEPFAAGTAADLMEIAGAQNGGLLPVVFAQPREEYRANGDVDSNSESIRPARSEERRVGKGRRTTW